MAETRQISRQKGPKKRHFWPKNFATNREAIAVRSDILPPRRGVAFSDPVKKMTKNGEKRPFLPRQSRDSGRSAKNATPQFRAGNLAETGEILFGL